MNLPDHEILLIRHAEANSNAGRPGEGTPLLKLTTEELGRLFSQGNATFENDDYLPDNLTQHGDQQLTDYMARFDQSGPLQLVLCSQLPRSIITAKKMSRGQTPIACIPGLRENTNWSQDLPPITMEEDGKRYALSVKLQGGPGLNSGALVGQDIKIDMTIDGSSTEEWERWNVPEERWRMVQTRDLDHIEEEDRRVRHTIRSMIIGLAQGNGSEKVRVAVIMHGGKLNTLLGDYRPLYKENGHGGWEWASSTIFGNLDTAVFKFTSATDDEAKLVEVDQSDHLRQTFGPYYRYLGSPDHKNKDGREDYKLFLKKVDDEVKSVISGELGNLLYQWSGSEALVDSVAQEENRESGGRE